MPVTFNVVNHAAKKWSRPKVTTSEDLLDIANPKQFRRCNGIIQSSFTPDILESSHISASENGFVWAAHNAYSTHHHLTIRPEDVWFAILTQLGFYINANAEKLRDLFVAHKGQKELVVEAYGSLHTVDFGVLAGQLTDLISKNVNDPELKTWVMPSFTTTYDVDRAVGAVLFMGAMQKYFSCGVSICCGIPSVTLLGELSDWEDILSRLDKLDQLGDQPTQFAEMLRPVLRHFILSFKEPTSPEVIRFWNTIATKHEVGSGTDYLSGWITAFCFWDEEGNAKCRRSEDYVLDEVLFPVVDVDAVPAGSASVPVEVNDNGIKYSCTMVAGSVGIQVTQTSDTTSPEQASTGTSQQVPQSSQPSSSAGTAIQPLSGWWIYKNESTEKKMAREEEKKKLTHELNALEMEKDDDVRMKTLPRTMEVFCRLKELEAY